MSGWGTDWLLPIVLAILVCFGMIRLLRSVWRQVALDVPNHRSLHETPVPRTGGWAILVGILCGVMLSPLGLSLSIASAFALLVLISAVDDVRGVPARARLGVQFLAVALVIFGLPVSVSWWWQLPLMIGGVWVVNLYNFMDGMDGFAGSMTAIGFTTLGIICAWRGQPELTGVCALVAACSIVFLYYNWPPADIFLGDTGSTVIGLLVVTVSLVGWQSGTFDLWIPAAIFAPFWLDATLTLMSRILSRQRWWEAHREHWYQRSALKVGVKKALRRELVVMYGTSTLVLLLVIFGKA